MKLIGAEEKSKSQYSIIKTIEINNWKKNDIIDKDFLINKLNSIFNINKSEIKILIVEDNENNRFIIKELLNNLKWKNQNTAVNGLDALKKIKECHFDIILMDINMPVMDGKKTVLEIYKMYKESNIAQLPYLIALTANDLYHDFYNKYMNDVLMKPIININQLENILQKFIIH